MRQSCPCCDGSDLSLYSSASYIHLPVYRCASCGAFFNGDSEQEVRQEAKRIYEQEYWNINKQAVDLDPEYRRLLLESQLAYCNFPASVKTILEIGSGTGQMLAMLEQKGYEVTGIEPDERNVSMINQKMLVNGRCLVGFIEEMEGLPGSYDVVWMSHVFEHLISPEMVLRKLHPLVNSVLFIEVPNCENPAVLKSSIYDNPSSFHFTKKALMTLAERCGYAITKFDYIRPANKMERVIHRKSGLMSMFVKGNKSNSDAMRGIFRAV